MVLTLFAVFVATSLDLDTEPSTDADTSTNGPYFPVIFSSPFNEASSFTVEAVSLDISNLEVEVSSFSLSFVISVSENSVCCTRFVTV